MPNIPFTGKKYPYRIPRRVKKNSVRMLTVIQLYKLSKIAGPINGKGQRGVNRQTIDERLKAGWTAWEAVHLPVVSREKKISLTKPK